MRRAYDEKYRFLSTPSARRATAWSFATRSPTIISIHALREEGDLFSQVCKDGIVISIHALREEGDGTSWSWRTLPCISIHALREEGDIQARLFAAHDDISIHALREEGDDNDVDKFIASFDFYPRPPRGGRL